MGIRNAIKSRLEELGWTRYRLAKTLAPHMSMQGVYQYLSGRNDVSGENLQRMMDSLGLEVGPKGRPLVEKPCGNPVENRKPRKEKALTTRRRKV